MSRLNYHHLHYFWVVAQEGGFARAADRLGVAVQTITAQVRALEQALGQQLLKPAGRRLVPTEAGRVAFRRAEEIFLLGQLLPMEVAQAARGPVARLTVGLSDGLSKLTAHSLLAPVLDTPGLHLVCHEGEFEQLQAELARQQLDLVLACQPALPAAGLRLGSERLVAAPVDWYGPARLLSPRLRAAFPASLAELPLLLPTSHTPLRAALDRWFEQQGLRPRVVGEFEDSALMAVFAARGLGVFPLGRLGADDAPLLPSLRRLGVSPGLREEVYALRARRSHGHPLVEALLAAAAERARREADAA